jgi:hypothetical protein
MNMDIRIKMDPLPKPPFQRGVATIEFALLVVPLLLMLFGVVEYGRAIYQYNTLAKSVRDATRFLTTVSPGDNPSILYPGETTYQVAKCLAVYGKAVCNPATDTPLAPGLSTGMVGICDAVSCSGTHQNVPFQGAVGGSANLVTVTISGFKFYPMPFNLSYYGETVGLPSVINFDDISNTMRQALIT